MTEFVPLNPAEHARQFATTYADRFELYVEGRMHELDVPEEQIGSSDYVNGVSWRVFFPSEGTGGGNTPGGRISVDSGVLNPELNASEVDESAQALWIRSRLRDRIDAAIAHEFEEARLGTHKAAVAAAAGTSLPIRDEARLLLRVIAEGWRGDAPTPRVGRTPPW